MKANSVFNLPNTIKVNADRFDKSEILALKVGGTLGENPNFVNEIFRKTVHACVLLKCKVMLYS